MRYDYATVLRFIHWVKLFEPVEPICLASTLLIGGERSSNADRAASWDMISMILKIEAGPTVPFKF